MNIENQNQILESIDKSIINLENLKNLQTSKVRELEKCKDILETMHNIKQFTIIAPTTGQHFKPNELKCFEHIKKMIVQEFELKAEKLIYEIENFVSHNLTH